MNARPSRMHSICSSVIARRGSSGADHSGTGGATSSSSFFSPTSTPTAACSTDFATDHDSSLVSGPTGSAGPSKCGSAPPYRSATKRPFCVTSAAYVVPYEDCWSKSSSTRAAASRTVRDYENGRGDQLLLRPDVSV